MHYIIYKTTNLINGKIYIGAHGTKDLDDGYLGSGTILQRAIKKYNIENFKREILFECNSRMEMLDKERKLVDKDFIKSEKNYNLCIGGIGYITDENPFYNKQHTKETREKMSKSRIGKTFSDEWKNNISKATAGKNNPMYGSKWVYNIETKENRVFRDVKKAQKLVDTGQWKFGRWHSKQTREKQSKAMKGRKFTEEHKKHLSEAMPDRRGKNSPFYGKHHTEEAKRKIGLINKGNKYHLGKHHTEETKKKIGAANKDRDFGKWIYNNKLKKHKRVKNPDEWLNNGWTLGRKKSKKE